MSSRYRVSNSFFLGIFFLFLVAAGLLVSGCADEASSASKLSGGFDDFARISSKGKSVLLEAANLESRFTYNFYIGEHEVTRAEYSRFSGSPVADGEGELPVSGVSWYDAALYANALSKSFRLDTVYSYTGRTFDPDGRAVFLENLSVDYSRDGYRLPTEAEWTFAAGKGWNPSSLGWTAENSGYAPHPACSLGRDGSGLCDMAGNVAEWTGDWMSDLSDTSVSDFVGGSGPNALDEVILKGGSFRNSASNVSLKNRKDIYTVTPSMSADYVGFRLVRGAIPSPVSAGTARDTSSAADVRVPVSPKELRRKLGTYQAKLAFRDDATGNIGFVNFMASTPRAVEIPDTLDAYHPSISPDGKLVAFCTKPEGISGKSSLYVRNLDANGSGLVKLDVESAAIPRWRVVGADTQIVYVTSAGNNSDAAAWKTASTWAVSFSGGRFGEPRKLFDGTYNGGVSADGRLAVSGARLLRASADGKESVWYSGEQACNASLSDTTKRTLFLDFGGETGKSFAGKGYDAHEMLLIADSTGKLSEMVPSPAGYAFDHTEWVRGREGLAVATLTDAGGAHAKIALVNLSDSSVLELAEGRELWHPDLWVSNASSQNIKLDPDSAGVYLTGEYKMVSEFFVTRYDLELLYKYRDSITVLISGSSRPWGGIYPPYLNSLTNEFSVNASNAAVDIQVAKRILLKYGKNLCPKLKVIVFSLDLDIFYQRYYENPNFWEMLYATVPGYAYDVNHDFWKDGYPTGLYELTKDSYGSDDSERKRYENTLGYFQNQAIDWGGDPELAVDSTRMDGVENLPDSLLAVPLEIIQEAEKNGIYAIGIIFPQSPKYANTGAFGRYGLRRSVAEQIIKKLRELETKYPHFFLMDENKMGNHDYTDDMAMNWDHLAPLGASQLTARLASLLKTIK